MFLRKLQTIKRIPKLSKKKFEIQPQTNYLFVCVTLAWWSTIVAIHLGGVPVLFKIGDSSCQSKEISLWLMTRQDNRVLPFAWKGWFVWTSGSSWFSIHDHKTHLIKNWDTDPLSVILGKYGVSFTTIDSSYLEMQVD